MSFRRRTFPEVLDNILTSVTRGVAAEAHPFPPPGASGPPFRHSLQKAPASDIVSVYGSRLGEPFLFRGGADYRLTPDGLSLEWLTGVNLPDEGTLFHVNYHPASAQPDLTDIYTGSVVRTLAESISLEIAGLYAQLEVVYDAGFIDTATGSALDKVVALLGIERVEGGRAAGDIEFTRSPASRGAISIPSGTRIMTADGEIEYETTASVTMAPGQNVIRVTARDLEVNDPVAADSLTVLPVPIAGVAGVTNPAPTALTAQDETDGELRTRAKEFLYGSERATLGAIQTAIKKQGLSADVDEISDKPGYVKITPHAESIAPEVMQRLVSAIDDARPAGVLVDVVGVEPPRRVNLELRITTAAGLLEQDLRAAQQAAREKIADYFARLPAREPGSINRIVGLVLSVTGIEDVRILSATWNATPADVLNVESGQLDIAGFPTVLGELHIADPNLPTLLNVVVTHPEDQTPPDSEAIQTALTETLTYINNVNASEPSSDPADAARRVLSYGKMLRVVPLPNKAGESLEAFDTAVTPPALPDEASIAPYAVQFTFTIESGLSRILSQAADEAYTLTPFERLSLSGVELHAEAADA